MDARSFFCLYHANLERMIKAAARADHSVFNDRAPVWKEFMRRRPEYASLFDLQQMFSGQSKVFGSSSGGTTVESDRRSRFQLQLDRFRHVLTPEELGRYTESTFGAPWIFDIDGYISSEWFIYNAAMTAILERTLATLKFEPKALKVLEIGSGYGGMASLLVQRHAVQDYHFVDLHENLFLAMNYMGYHHPEFAIRMAEDSNVGSHDGAFTFYLPSQAQQTPNHFDLALNTSSLGEMPKDTAASYVKLIAGKLRQGGLFFSHNAVGSYAPHYSAEEIDNFQPPIRISDYNYLSMDIKLFRPTPAPNGIDHEMHHLIVCTPKTGNSPVLSAADFDTLGFLIEALLGKDIEPLCDRFAAGRLTPDDRRFLDAAQDMLTQTDSGRKISALTIELNDPALQAAIAFLRSCILLSAGDTLGFINEAAAYLQIGRSDCALIWSALHLHVAQEFQNQSPIGLRDLPQRYPAVGRNIIASAHFLYERKAEALARLQQAQTILLRRLNPAA